MGVRSLVRIAGLTLALGTMVVLSWMVVRGPSVLQGPGPFLDPTWSLIWAIQAALVTLIGWIAGRRLGPGTSGGRLVGLVTMAWFAELLVVALLGPLLSDDLHLAGAPWVWAVATGGPIQPLAAIVGALTGRATLRRVTSGQTA